MNLGQQAPSAAAVVHDFRFLQMIFKDYCEGHTGSQQYGLAD